MRICSVHGSLDTAFRELGHEVLSLRPGPGFFALDSALAEQGFAPGLVVQQERLGPRTLLQGLGQDLDPLFEPGKEIPVYAHALELKEVLSHALARPGSLRVQRQMNGLLAAFRGTEQVRMGLLSSLTMRNQDNWRDGLELAMVNLRIFRIRQGLEEAVAARDDACSKGEEHRFYRLLAGMDPGDTLARTLKQPQLH